MNNEQILLNKWRSLTTFQQQEVLDFVDFIRQKSSGENRATILSFDKSRRVKDWIDWAESNPKDSSDLPDNALRRESIYDED